MLTPSNGFCSTPLTRLGSGKPALSRMVGITSIRCTNWRRMPGFLIRAGQEMAMAVLLPPPEVTSLPYVYGVDVA
jgi:hypothetical protein